MGEVKIGYNNEILKSLVEILIELKSYYAFRDFNILNLLTNETKIT